MRQMPRSSPSHWEKTCERQRNSGQASADFPRQLGAGSLWFRGLPGGRAVRKSWPLKAQATSCTLGRTSYPCCQGIRCHAPTSSAQVVVQESSSHLGCFWETLHFGPRNSLLSKNGLLKGERYSLWLKKKCVLPNQHGWVGGKRGSKGQVDFANKRHCNRRQWEYTFSGRRRKIRTTAAQEKSRMNQKL